jgi:hypothetical protein
MRGRSPNVVKRNSERRKGSEGLKEREATAELVALH